MNSPESLPKLNPEFVFSKEEMEKAEDVFEHLARRLDYLWSKPELTEREKREAELIINNAFVLQDVIQGKFPEEFQEFRKAS